MSLHGQSAPQPRKSDIKTAFQRFFMGVHIFLYRRTNGGIGGNLAGRSMLLLTTIGRKSGQERVTPIFYFSDNGRFVLMASNGGSPQHPQWFFNLQANPQARVQVGPRTIAVTAQQALGEEREHLWSLVTSQYPEFGTYQKRAQRTIPVVILSPE